MRMLASGFDSGLLFSVGYIHTHPAWGGALNCPHFVEKSLHLLTD